MDVLARDIRTGWQNVAAEVSEQQKADLSEAIAGGVANRLRTIRSNYKTQPAAGAQEIWT